MSLPSAERASDHRVAGACKRYVEGDRLPEVGRDHPSRLFLTIEEVGDKVTRSGVVCFVGQSEDGTLLSDEDAKSFKDSGDDVGRRADVGLLLELAYLEVFAEAVFRRATELEDTLCDFVDGLCSLIVHLLELAVEREELRAEYVPVVATEVGVIYLEVSEQLLETLDDWCDLSGIKACDREYVHCLIV